MIWPFKKKRLVRLNISTTPVEDWWIEGEVKTDGLGREYVILGHRGVYFLKNYPSTHILYVNYTPKVC